FDFWEYWLPVAPLVGTILLLPVVLGIFGILNLPAGVILGVLPALGALAGYGLRWRNYLGIQAVITLLLSVTLAYLPGVNSLSPVGIIMSVLMLSMGILLLTVLGWIFGFALRCYIKVMGGGQ